MSGGDLAMLWEKIARRAFGLDDHDSPPPLLPQSKPASPLKIGLALGGGAARGWAHIGVLEALRDEGVFPDVITGTSIGAVAGGCFAAGRIDALKDFANSLTKRRVLGLMDFQFGGSGLISGQRLKALLEKNLQTRTMEDLSVTFAAIATEVGTGHEIWLTKGCLCDALRASYALPGVLPSIRIGGRWLMDGALVNPVPVTAARALGADLVIAVNLNGDMRLRGTIIQSHGGEDRDEVIEAVLEKPHRHGLFRNKFLAPVFGQKDVSPGPGLTSVMIDAFNITQDRIARSRLAGDPPDIMVTPKLGTIGLFEFHRAEEAMTIGRQAMEKLIPDLKELIRGMAPAEA
jgi:NTE family protein